MAEFRKESMLNVHYNEKNNKWTLGHYEARDGYELVYNGCLDNCHLFLSIIGASKETVSIDVCKKYAQMIPEIVNLLNHHGVELKFNPKLQK